MLLVRDASTRRSIVRGAADADGARSFAVFFTRELHGRDALVVGDENRALLARVLANGGASLFAGALPRGRTEWRAQLGAAYEEVAAAKRIADPRGVLGFAL